MNKHEFYKELLKEYTFDSAKVRRGAKQSSLRVVNRSWFYTAAVAAVSLIVGISVWGSDLLMKNGDNPTVEQNTKEDRIDSAKLAIQRASAGFGTKTLYLSFNNSITLQEMRDSLDSVSDTGNIVVEAVYVLEDDNKVALFRVSDNSEELEALNGAGKIIGAKVYAPTALIDELNGQREVALVEIGDDIPSDDEFVPLIAVDLESPTTSNPATVEAQTEIPSETSAPVVGYTQKYIDFNIPNISEVSFISDYRFTAVTPDTVMLCEISKTNFEVEVISEFSLRNYKKRPSITGKSTLYSGVDRDGKTVMLLADADSATLENIDVTTIVESSELLNAFYDDVNRRVIMRVRSRDNNSIYIIDRDTFGQLLVPSTTNDAVTLAVNGNSIYFSSGTSVLKYDISEGLCEELYTFPAEAVRFERNADLSGFIANYNGEALVFFAEAEIFTQAVAAPTDLVFYGDSKDLLTDGANFYKASANGTIEVYTGQPYSNERHFSGSGLFKTDEITRDSVKILIL